MGVPTLTREDVKQIVSNCEVVDGPFRGGQKIVYSSKIDGEKFALKFIEIVFDEDDSIDYFSEAVERAKREVSIMDTCKSPYIVKLGPVPIDSINYQGKNILFFSEEWIEGMSLKKYIKEKGKLDIKKAVKLAIHITTAIEELWGQVKVHRDIKPDNIMYDMDNERFVMLDLGLALDLEDKSLTKIGMVPGTKIYLSPDQLNVSRKRQLDFRADIFCLGIVLYEAYFGVHPFYKFGMRDEEIFRSILFQDLKLPKDINFEVNEKFYAIICRMLSKRAHKRYKNCRLLISELEHLLTELEGA